MSTNRAVATQVTDDSIESLRLQAFQLLADVITQRDPQGVITASQARVQMKRRSYGGFEPQKLGYLRFRDFLVDAAKHNYITIDDARPGDYGLSLAGDAHEHPLPDAPIRSDLWKAFLTWSPELQRVYDVEHDRAVVLPIEPAPFEPHEFRQLRERLQNNPNQFVAIQPIGLTTQVKWMRDFTSSMPESNIKYLLTKALTGEKPAKLFSGVLRQFPEEQRRWYQMLRANVSSHIDDWRTSAGTDSPINIVRSNVVTNSTEGRAERESLKRPRTETGNNLSTLVRALSNFPPISENTSIDETLLTLLSASSVTASRRGGDTTESAGLRSRLHAAIDRMPVDELRSISIPIGYLFED